jgi:hypothetical protein
MMIMASFETVYPLLANLRLSLNAEGAEWNGIETEGKRSEDGTLECQHHQDIGPLDHERDESIGH